MTIQLTAKQKRELADLMSGLGAKLTWPRKAETWILKSKWYRPQTLQQLINADRKCPPSFVDGSTEPVKGSPCYNSRVPLCPSNWPSDIAAFYANQGD